MKSALVRLAFSLAMLVNSLLYSYYAFSFASRPDDMPRWACAILAAIYFVGIAILLDKKD